MYSPNTNIIMDKFIIEYDLKLISDFFKQLNRQGPGSEEVTKKALSFIDNLRDVKQIVDFGCGTGTQTITLAENTKAHITAIDLLPDMIDHFDMRIKQKGLEKRITTLTGSMDDSLFSENELDLIWAEGSIYNIGFEEGLTHWRKFLKPQHYVAVSEATWFTSERPKEVEEFWNSNYPGIDTVPNKLIQMEKAGYMPVAYFNLPEYCWTNNFFKPMPEEMDRLLVRHNYSDAAKGFVNTQSHEITIYEKYKDYYGYVFYIGKKI